MNQYTVTAAFAFNQKRVPSDLQSSTFRVETLDLTTMAVEMIHVDSPNVAYSADQITVNYDYATTSVKRVDNRLVVSVM